MILHEKGKHKSTRKEMSRLILMHNLIRMPVTVFVDAADVCQYLGKEGYLAGYHLNGCHKEPK